MPHRRAASLTCTSSLTANLLSVLANTFPARLALGQKRQALPRHGEQRRLPGLLGRVRERLTHLGREPAVPLAAGGSQLLEQAGDLPVHVGPTQRLLHEAVADQGLQL